MWSTFVHMNREDVNQAIEYERDPNSSGEEEKEELEEEEQEEPEEEEKEYFE